MPKKIRTSVPRPRSQSPMTPLQRTQTPPRPTMMLLQLIQVPRSPPVPRQMARTRLTIMRLSQQVMILPPKIQLRSLQRHRLLRLSLWVPEMRQRSQSTEVRPLPLLLTKTILPLLLRHPSRRKQQPRKLHLKELPLPTEIPKKVTRR